MQLILVIETEICEANIMFSSSDGRYCVYVVFEETTNSDAIDVRGGIRGSIMVCVPCDMAKELVA